MLLLLAFIGLCRLFHDDPATSARFSHLDPRDRSHAPPCQILPRGRCVHAVGRRGGIHPTVRAVRPHPRVVIVGAGFGGLQCAKALRDEPVDVMLVDRQNYHLFTPLLYQVASCLLNPSEITAPLRKVFRGAPNVRYRQGDVVDVDFARNDVRLADGATLEYDYARPRDRQRHQLLRQRRDRSRARSASRISARRCSSATTCSSASSGATATTDADERRRLLTFCIVGGGPTGVEYAGALAELVRLVLPHEYPSSRRPTCASCCSKAATACCRRSSRACRSTRAASSSGAASTCAPTRSSRRPTTTGVVLRDGTELPTASIVWTAGVRPSNVPRASGRDAHRAAALRGRRPPARPRRRARVRDRRRRGRARPARPAAADALAARDAGRPLRRPPDRATAAGAASSATATRARWRRSGAGPRSRQIGPIQLTGLPRLGRRGSSCTSTT